MVALKVRSIGNSLGVVLPKEALTILRVKEGDTIYFSEAPGGARLTPYDERIRRQMEAAEVVMREDKNVLRELAK